MSMFPKSDEYGYDGSPVAFRLLKVDKRWILLSAHGLEQPDTEIVLVYETNCDPETCLKFEDTTMHLGYLERRGESHIRKLSGHLVPDDERDSSGWIKQPEWRKMDEAPEDATHRFRVVTSDIWDHGNEAYEQHTAKTPRFR